MTPKTKIFISFGLLMLFFAVVGFKLVDIQILNHEVWTAQAESIQIREIVQNQPRGRIYDRNGVLLAFDVKATSIALDNYHMTRPELLSQLLQKHLDLSAERVNQLVYREGYFTWIARKVDVKIADALRQEAEELGIWGLLYYTEWKRVYPQGALASNIIGFAGVDNVGLEGIELQFNDVLSGRDEIREVVRGARGTLLSSRIVQEGVPGNDIYLTIDTKIQHKAEERIQTAARFRSADGAFAVILDPMSADILALASDKTYDLNDYQNATAEEKNNWIVSLTFEPGSTFKPLPVLAALEAGTITPTSTCNANDDYHYFGRTFSNALHRSYGSSVSIGTIVEGSMNTGVICIMRRMVDQMGKEEAEQYFYQFLRKFGFGEPLGTDFPGEVGGILRTPDRWGSYDSAAISIGQAVSVTGVQLAAAYAAFANGGTLMTPQIINRIELPSGELLPSPRNTNPRKVISDESADQLRVMMRRVIEGELGTGGRARIAGFEIAGKSGTGQKAIPGRGYVDGLHYSLFSGFFPASNPQYVMTVVFDEVKYRDGSNGWYFGGTVSAPVFKEIAEAIIVNQQMKPVVEN